MEYMQIVVPPLKICFHITDTVVLHDILCVWRRGRDGRGEEKGVTYKVQIYGRQKVNLIARLACNNHKW